LTLQLTKDGLNGTWLDEAGNVTSFAVDG